MDVPVELQTPFTAVVLLPPHKHMRSALDSSSPEAFFALFLFEYRVMI